MSEGRDINSETFTSDTSETPLVLNGYTIDTAFLETAYIATGSGITADVSGKSMRGAMEVPIWLPNGKLNPKFAALTFNNATYINGAIVMTMDNGCEGNIVVIPVQRGNGNV
jgi:hypothetical protein